MVLSVLDTGWISELVEPGCLSELVELIPEGLFSEERVLQTVPELGILFVEL